MSDISFIQQILLWVVPLLFAITLHEVAHGWVALLLGDPTAKMLGRLTMNPFKHIDPIGTVVVPITLILLGGFVFGWAKPVPVTYENLKHKPRDIALVAIAGPSANLIMAIGWAICVKCALLAGGNAANAAGLPLAFLYMGQIGIIVNLALFALNLLPIPPLDGSRILSALIPGRWSWYLHRVEPYGFIILLLLLASGLLVKLIEPLIQLLRSLLMTLFGI
jgi:Zn-dependent protease